MPRNIDYFIGEVFILDFTKVTAMNMHKGSLLIVCGEMKFTIDEHNNPGPIWDAYRKWVIHATPQ